MEFQNFLMQGLVSPKRKTERRYCAMLFQHYNLKVNASA